MRITPSQLPGVMLVTVDAHRDERGLFARTFDAAVFAEAGLPTAWPQCNLSWNASRGTLRGMHFQRELRGEPKLVRCTRGRIFDVAVDIRPDSATCGQWVGAELSHEAHNALFIPSGFAHGFLTLEDDCEVFYMMGDVFAPELAGGCRWNDLAFGIDWPFAPVILSERDANWADFAP
jgi:dTDP-4-dehydrorhamnose 3,5-epimerase